MRFRGARRNDVADRFGLGKVHFAVQEGPKSKLARLGHAGAAGEQQRENLAHRDRASVAGDFDDILARVGFWPMENGDEDVIDDLGIIYHPRAVECMAAIRMAKLTLAENLIADEEGVRPA